MELFALTTAFTVAASSVFAGALAFEAPVLPEMIVEEFGAMGGSGLWSIPLLLIALIFLLVRKNVFHRRDTNPVGYSSLYSR